MDSAREECENLASDAPGRRSRHGCCIASESSSHASHRHNAKARNTLRIVKTLFLPRKPAVLVAYRALSDLAGKGSFFLITIVAARRLSRQDFGIFALATTLGWLLSVATDFGIQMHVARGVARQAPSAARILRAWLRVRLWVGVAAIGSVAAGVFAWPGASDYRGPIVLFAVVYVCSGLVEFLHYFFRGLSRSDVESSLVLWQRLSTLALAVGVLMWRPDLRLLAIAMLLPIVTTLLVSARIAFTLAGSDHGSAPMNVAVEFRRDVLPIGAGIVVSALYFRIDVFLVQHWSGTDAVALYNAVFRLIDALRLFPAAVMAVVLPSLVRATDSRPLQRVSMAVLAFSVPLAAVLWIGAGWVVPLIYGAPYAAAVPAFRILALCLPLFSLNYALTHQLIGWDGERSYAVICATALLANLALNARLIPALSIDGAAWATLWTEVVLAAGCAWALWSRHVRPAPVAVLRQAQDRREPGRGAEATP